MMDTMLAALLELGYDWILEGDRSAKPYGIALWHKDWLGNRFKPRSAPHWDGDNILQVVEKAYVWAVKQQSSSQ